MTLNDTVLQKVAEWQPTGNGRLPLLVPDAGSGWAVTVTADRNDDLGCLVWEMAWRRTGPATRGETLKGWADGVSRRVTGLLEPLKVLEVDDRRGEALLRSGEPTRKGPAVRYYEVLLKGTTEAVLRRYHGSPQGDKRREQVAFPLTHEALAKVAGDLVGNP
jgi:hypothetical protein